MNNTNRVANRVFLVLVGLLLVAAGAVAGALALVPAVATAWSQQASSIGSAAPDAVSAPVAGTATLVTIGIVVVAVVLLILLLLFVLGQGRGHTAEALRTGEAGQGTRIDLAVPRALLEEHLQARGDLVGVRISAYEVRGTPMLKVAARCRRGVSPARVAAEIGRAVADLERILGADVPALIQLSGGFRARSAARARLT